jgi:chromate transport protein ChrA
MKRLIQMLALLGAICTPTSLMLWIFAYDLGIHRELSVNLLFTSLGSGGLAIVLHTIYDIIYGED